MNSRLRGVVSLSVMFDQPNSSNIEWVNQDALQMLIKHLLWRVKTQSGGSFNFLYFAPRRPPYENHGPFIVQDSLTGRWDSECLLILWLQSKSGHALILSDCLPVTPLRFYLPSFHFPSSLTYHLVWIQTLETHDQTSPCDPHSI